MGKLVSWQMNKWVSGKLCERLSRFSGEWLSW